MSDAEELMRSPCYLSTPEHVRSFVGRFIYVYTAKGEVRLSKSALVFLGSNGIEVGVALDLIEDVSVGHYSRWVKPFRLDYVAVRCRYLGDARTMLLTPTRSWATPVWETNKIVAAWASAVRAACPGPA